MMPEISLNVLDVAENSVRAKAKRIRIEVAADIKQDALTIVIDDDGKGMDAETLAHVADPFYTTRTTRKVGLGVSFFKLAAEQTGGSFSIRSEEGKGTCVTAVFVLSSIDRMPLGDMPATIHTLVTTREEIAFVYRFAVAGENDDTPHEFILDTEEMRALLAGVSFQTPEVSAYIRDYLKENTTEVLRDAGVSEL